jgi:hypothetical protein
MPIQTILFFRYTTPSPLGEGWDGVIVSIARCIFKIQSYLFEMALAPIKNFHLLVPL